MDYEDVPPVPDDYSPGYDSVSISARKYLGDAYVSYQHIVPDGSAYTWRYEGPVVTLVYGERFLFDGSKFNQCISSLTDGKSKHPWAGPMLVFKQQDSTIGTGLVERVEDADIETLECAKQFLSKYGKI